MAHEARFRLLLAMSLPLAACGPGPRPDPGPTTATIVRTEEGALRGERLDNGVGAFRGVPYAQPPVGDRRWKAPAPTVPWYGECDAIRFAPACPQDDGTAVYYRRAARRLGRDSTGIAPLGPTSEDCLYLNVWTPEPEPGSLLPVLVWIHGGAGTSGSGTDRLFRGRHLAARGVVVVTINYRLGALGFLAHPALSREDPDGVCGKYGYQDILQALRWIRANAVAFGGDPERIAVAGQSAGASLAELLMVTPAATTLFHRVIAQSATLLRPLPLRTDDEGDSGEAEGFRFMARLGLGADASAAELRAIPVDSLIAAMARAGDDTPSRPVIDGRLIPDNPARLWARGEFAHFPMLLGSADDEMALLMPPTPIEPDDYRHWYASSTESAPTTSSRNALPGTTPNRLDGSRSVCSPTTISVRPPSSCSGGPADTPRSGSTASPGNPTTDASAPSTASTSRSSTTPAPPPAGGMSPKPPIALPTPCSTRGSASPPAPSPAADRCRNGRAPLPTRPSSWSSIPCPTSNRCPPRP